MAAQLTSVRLADGRLARLVFTGRPEGDLRPATTDINARRSLTDHPWSWLTQVHGAEVVTVSRPGDHAGAEADASVTATTGAALVVQTADCAPIVLVAAGGAVGVVHAGWRGLVAGVVDAAVDALSELAPGPIEARLGPCIHAECYQFSAADLDRLAERFGPGVIGRTTAGDPALDLPAAVEAALNARGIDVDRSASSCTACGDGWFSHRARAESERQVLVAWIDEVAP